MAYRVGEESVLAEGGEGLLRGARLIKEKLFCVTVKTMRVRLFYDMPGKIDFTTSHYAM